MQEIKVFTAKQSNGVVCYNGCVVSKVFFLNIYDWVCKFENTFGLSRLGTPHNFETYREAYKATLEAMEQIKIQEQALNNQEIEVIDVDTHSAYLL
jgi:hypothetical protein